MSAYQLLPSPSIAIPVVPFATWRGEFTNEEINRIIEIGNRLTLSNATVGNGQIYSTIRESKTGWISLNSETQFLYDRLGFVARQLNGQFFDFDIWGFSEDLQYTIYDSSNSHYTWHVDHGGNTNRPPRKLSLVLQLSDPHDYEGGDLEILTDSEPLRVDKERGLVTAFPSYVLHRVTPVTRGIRKTIVVWLTGPRFK
jgi:PKHD-type hydroxylase